MPTIELLAQIKQLQGEVKILTEEILKYDDENSKLKLKNHQLKEFSDSITNELIKLKSKTRKALEHLDRCGYILKYEILDGEEN